MNTRLKQSTCDLGIQIEFNIFKLYEYVTGSITARILYIYFRMTD